MRTSAVQTYLTARLPAHSFTYPERTSGQTFDLTAIAILLIAAIALLGAPVVAILIGHPALAAGVIITLAVMFLGLMTHRICTGR